MDLAVWQDAKHKRMHSIGSKLSSVIKITWAHIYVKYIHVIVCILDEKEDEN